MNDVDVESVNESLPTLHSRDGPLSVPVPVEQPLSERRRGCVLAVAFKVVAVSAPQRPGPPQSGLGVAADYKAFATQHTQTLCSDKKSHCNVSMCNGC